MKTYNEGMPELPQNTEMEDVEWFELVENIIDYCNKNKGEDNFCLISFFNTLSTRLEIAADDFQKQDPDPIDMRHPVYLAPSCEYGTILRGFEKQLDFMTSVTTEYVKDNTCKSFDGLDITVAEAACRFLLVVYPAIDILLDNEETMTSLCETLYSYALRNVNPLATYALGILSKHSETMVLSSKLNKADENTTLVNNSLQELWQLTTGGEPQRTTLPAQQQASSSTKTDVSMSNSVSADKQQQEVVSLIGKKRKRSSFSALSFPSSSDDQKKCKVRKHETSSFEISMPSVNDMPEANFSSSSWKEMRPIVVGSQYSLKPPLNEQVRQLHLLNYLAPLAEYQDVLSLFIKHNALGLVLWYLERSSTNNGLITYAAMKLLAGLLCHQKITLVFIERKGIDKLLKVPRPSIGATGGGLILYYLSYHKEAMMLMAGLEKKVVSEMTKFAMWLLESSHDSGRCHAALFLLYAFPYQPFLKMFDSRNGLRYLVNMISTLPIMNGEENDDDEVAEERNNFHSYRQVTKTACTTLKKYLETHLKMEVGAVTARMNKGEWPFDPTKSVEIGGRSEMLSHIDFLRFASHDKRGKPFDTPTQPWQVAKSFLKLDGIRLLMKVLAIARRWSCPNRVEVVRYTLDCLAIVTLSSAAWPQLLTKMPDSRDFDPDTDDDDEDDDEDESVAENGLHTILRLSQREDNISGNTEPQRSALAVLVNCVCSPHLMKPRKEGQKSSGGGGSGGCSSGGGSCSNPMSDGNISTPALTSNKHSIEESLRQAWMFIKTHNGIHSLLDLLDQKSLQTSVDVDEFRLLACQALCGLSCCSSIRQILSKLPFFNSSELLTLAQKPVLQSNQQEHTRFRSYMLMLVERVWGKPSKLNVDLESQRKDHIVTRTPIRFNNNELLRVIHDHLVWSGLTESANKLAQEASLPVKQQPVDSLISNNDKLSNSSSPSSSTSAHINRSESCEDGSSRNKISFTRGAVAQGKLPLLNKNIGMKQIGSWLSATGGSASRSKFKLPRRKGAFSLSGNGTISTSDSLPSAASASTTDPANPSGVGLNLSLNHIITDYLRTQHSKCGNPVVSVPEFSLFKKHRCPVSCHRLDAPRNTAQRHLHRQIYPRYGGLFGQQHDRQLIFGKMRPCTTFHDENTSYQGGANLYYSCCFSADESKIYIGNWRGDVIVRGLHGSNEANLMQLMDLNIVDISCTNDGQIMLCHGRGSDNYIGENRHELFALDPFDSRIYFDDLNHMELSKVQQDRLVGTDRSVAKIYDLNTGSVVTELAKDSWSSHYDDNRATFSYDDNLVLSDGILWDVRCSSAKPIHKFDKFNPKHSGIFHPQNLEVVINSEVWDLRSYHLLHTVPALDGKRVKFNHDGSAIYAAKWFDEDRLSSTPPSTTLTVIDGHTYNTFNVIDTRSELSNFACDKRNYYFATIEGRRDLGNVRRFCRLYEIGRSKEMGEDDDNDSDGESPLDEDGPYRPGFDDDDDTSDSGDFDESLLLDDSDDDDDDVLRDIEEELNEEDIDFSEADMVELEENEEDEDFVLEDLAEPDFLNFDNSDENGDF